MKQTILGAGGAIGIELAKVLPNYTEDIRLIARNPQKINSTDELITADLTNRDEVFRAVNGSQIVYVTIGFEYKTSVWQKLWPPFIKNTIDACLEHKAKLVFFDNVYAIGGDYVKHITEESPISPVSKKGEVRAEVNRLLLDAIEKRKLEAIIARAPDFFSSVKDKSLLMNLVYDNMAKGKTSQWFCNANVVHSFGYGPDLARGTAMLGNGTDTYNQIWNLPTDSQKITGEEWIELFAEVMDADSNYQTLPGWGMLLIGLFVPILKEMYEMRYQYDRDYFFDSSKFNNHFNYTPTTNATAVKETVLELSNTEIK